MEIEILRFTDEDWINKHWVDCDMTVICFCYIARDEQKELYVGRRWLTPKGILSNNLFNKKKDKWANIGVEKEIETVL